MRIGFDAKRAFNNPRGLGNYSRETLRILSSLAPENQYYLFTPDIRSDIGFTCPPNANLQTSNKKGGLAQSLWRTFGITREAERLKLDLYHGLSHELPFGIEKSGVRTVLTMHDLLFLRHPESYPAFDRLMYKKKYLHSCSVSDIIIAVSNKTKQDLLELVHLNPDKVEVVYQGCRPEFKKQASDEQKQKLREKYRLPKEFLLNVAAIEPRKNQLLILKAMVSKKLDIHLVIAGQKTGYLQELQNHVAKHGLQHQVTFLPNLPAEELPILYQCATIFVFPSFYEGFGIPILEALESGLPIIAATGSCLEESGGPDSLYVSPHDEQALAEQIQNLLDDPARRETMVEQGREYAQRFSDRAICQQLTRIYQNLLP